MRSLRSLLRLGWLGGGKVSHLCGCWVAAMLALAAPGANAGVDGRLSQELRLRAAVQAGDRVALAELAAVPAPDSVRARALWELHRGVRQPLAPGDRIRLLAALSDPSPEVRRAALRSIGETGERTLEREALKRVAEDPDMAVRVEALRAVRRWSRQGHLYFLEEALKAPAVQVRVEALRNLAQIAYREIAPVLVERIRQMAGGGGDPFVRGEALEVLRAWDRLEWRLVEGAIEDRTAPEALRVRALELGDAAGEGAELQAALLEVLDSDPSFRVAWECFRRLAGSGASRSEVAPPVARLLLRTPRKNAATEEMAAFLGSRGYRVEFRSGSWNVSAR